MNGILWALVGSLATFGATALGAGFVFFLRKEPSRKLQRIFLGGAAGIMIAALFWSLLIPAQEMAQAEGISPWLPMSIGFILGGLLLLLIDAVLPHEHLETGVIEGLRLHLGRRTMLVLAVTLHNIPEGLAVGLTFAAAAQSLGDGSLSLQDAGILALGLALQNIPEGAAISLPLHQDGLSKKKSFIYGMLSGAVEPIAAVIAAMLVEAISPAMPWLLSIAAGAMMYVVAEELIPEAHLGEHSHVGTFAVMIGFCVMMILEMTTA